MDKKYNGHAWCKVKMTNIKNPCGLILKALNVWPIFIVKMVLVLCFFDQVLAMKLIGVATCRKFLLLAKLFQILLSTPLP
jgi:hypothetical protein